MKVKEKGSVYTYLKCQENQLFSSEDQKWWFETCSSHFHEHNGSKITWIRHWI